MNHPARQFWFSNYWWLTPLASAIAVVVILTAVTPENRWTLIASVIGGSLALIFFCQKQRLSETQLFEKLFSQFNERYTKMNDKLEEVRLGTIPRMQEKKKILSDYFNLCAEEYLFWNEGRILPAAWQAWCRGMLYYITHENILGDWNREVESKSYYGLTFGAIKEGAGNLDGLGNAETPRQ